MRINGNNRLTTLPPLFFKRGALLLYTLTFLRCFWLFSSLALYTFRFAPRVLHKTLELPEIYFTTRIVAVSKTARKRSRGRAGRYSLTSTYVKPPKRPRLSLRR
jgi:hypothetical protein